MLMSQITDCHMLVGLVLTSQHKFSSRCHCPHDSTAQNWDGLRLNPCSVKEFLRRSNLRFAGVEIKPEYKGGL